MATDDGPSAARPAARPAASYQAAGGDMAAPVNLARGALNVNGGARVIPAQGAAQGYGALYVNGDARGAAAIFGGQGAIANLGANALNIVNGGAQGGAGNAGGYAVNVNAGAGMPAALPLAHPIFDIDEGLEGGPLRISTTGPYFRLK